ncbi:hypothetical protein ACWGB8_12840 [Kitasatospora sp. NPDC054939]
MALRQRRPAEQAPLLREEARTLPTGIDPDPAAAGQQGPNPPDGEQLAQAVRHARAVRGHLAAPYGTLGRPPDRARRIRARRAP